MTKTKTNKNYQTHEPCLVCGYKWPQRTYHHVKSRGSGGSDDVYNLMPLCLEHHNEVHKIGLFKFAGKKEEDYRNVENWLISNGWEILMDRWWHE